MNLHTGDRDLFLWLLHIDAEWWDSGGAWPWSARWWLGYGQK